MPIPITEFLAEAATTLVEAIRGLAIPAACLGGLAVLVKGRAVFADARRALGESRINLSLHLLDVLLVTPVLVLFTTALSAAFTALGLVLVNPDVWAGLPAALVAFIAIFAGDFAGYWRHRLEHSALLWPSHAIHHSDTEMTWLTLVRFHPINRLTTTVLDSAFLLALGFPPYALVINFAVRHYYGMFIHADLPWTFGPLGRVFVSPAMHRWHHANDPLAFSTNYATVFSVFDLAFGTYRVPGPCTAPLGVSVEMGNSVGGQLAHPFAWSHYRPLWRRSDAWRGRPS